MNIQSRDAAAFRNGDFYCIYKDRKRIDNAVKAKKAPEFLLARVRLCTDNGDSAHVLSPGIATAMRIETGLKAIQLESDIRLP